MCDGVYRMSAIADEMAELLNYNVDDFYRVRNLLRKQGEKRGTWKEANE